MRAGRSRAVVLVLAMTLGGCGGAAPAGSGSLGPGASGESPAASTGTSGATGSAGASGPATSAGASPAAGSPAAGATPKPVAAVKGTGFVDSKRFTLRAGTYVLRWTLTSTNAAGCTAIGAIHTPDGQTSVEIANTVLKGKATKSGSKSAPKLPAGSYVVTFATTCSWTMQVFRA